MATPSYVGQVGSFYSNATSSTGTMTTTAAVAVGDTVIVTTAGQASNFGVSCTDSVGNTYRVIGNQAAGKTATIFGSVITTAIPSGGTITATMNASNFNNQFYAVVFRNVALSGPVATANSFTTTTHTTGTVTPEQVNGIVLSLCGISGAYLNLTTSTSGFTVLPLTVASNQEWSQIAWKQVDSAAITPTSVVWTESAGTRNWGSVICALNATSGEFLNLF